MKSRWMSDRTRRTARSARMQRNAVRAASQLELLEPRCLLALAVDGFEPNQQGETATDLGVTAQYHERLSIGAPGDEDWFRWTADRDGELNVEILFSHAAGDLELELRDSRNVVVAGRYSSDDNEQLVYEATAGATYFVRVYGHAGSTNDYGLQLSGLFPDVFEENDSWQTASYLATGSQTHALLTLHDGNSDWYRWTANRDGWLNLGIQFAHAAGDLELELWTQPWEPERIGRAAGSWSSDDDEALGYSVVAGETYYFRVYGYQGALNSYALSIDGVFPLVPDEWEPNDSFAEARELGVGDQLLGGLTVERTGEFQSGDDFYRWTAAVDGIARFEALFVDALGNLDLELYDALYVLIGSSRTTTDNEFIEAAVAAEQDYFIRVLGWAGSTHPEYALVIDGPELLPDLVVTDLWEDAGRVAWQVRNVGEGVAVPGFYATLAADGATLDECVTPVELLPGQRWQGTFDWIVPNLDAPLAVSVHVDPANQIAESSEDNNVFEEVWGVDGEGPALVEGPAALEIAADSAVISWTTSEASQGAVRFGRLMARYDRLASGTELVTRHAIALERLEPDATYVAVVESTDSFGNVSTSAPFAFSTLPLEDVRPPEIALSEPGVISEVVEIHADAADDQRVVRVEFFVDDQLAYTDFSAPYAWEFDPQPYANGPHVISTRAVDAAGLINEAHQPIEIAKLIDAAAPVVSITAPAANATVAGQVTVRAELTDDAGLSVAQFYVDGVYSGFEGFAQHPTSATVEFVWDAANWSSSTARLAVQVFDVDGKASIDTVDVDVDHTPPPAPPKLVVTSHTATRRDNFLEVELKVKNTGLGAAHNVFIADAMQGFFPSTTATLTPFATYAGVHTPSTQWSDCQIATWSSLAPGQEYAYQFTVLPVMSYPNPPAPAIGQSIELAYEDQQGTLFHQTFALPIAYTEAKVSLADAHAKALKQADYLITTNPQYLSWQYSTQGPVQADDVNRLLTEMANLAQAKAGALGFFYSDHLATRTKLQEFTRPGGAWAIRLHDDFSHFRDLPQTVLGQSSGYMLIVGETEIMPSWPAMTFKGMEDYPVSYSDHPYSDTGGVGGMPDLIVGRVVGDSAAALIKPLVAAVGVYEEDPLHYFGRDAALVVSDPTVGDFKERADDRAAQLAAANFAVARMHWRDLYQEAEFARNFATDDGFGAGDVFGTSLAEIVLADASQQKVFFYDAGGAEAGQFSVPWWQGTDDDGFAIGDTDGDGRAEVLLADSSQNQIRVYEGNGWFSAFPCDFDAHDALTAGDVDGDGSDEILVGDLSSNAIRVYSAAGTLQSSFILAAGFDQFDGLVAADVEGTSDAEILVGDWSAKTLYVYDSAGNELGRAEMPGSGKASDRPRLLAGNLGGTGNRVLVAAGGGDIHLRLYEWQPSSAEYPHGVLLKRGVAPCEDLNAAGALAVGNVANYRLDATTDEILFVDPANKIQIINPRDDHFRAKVREQLPALVTGRDVIHYDGHGNIRSWDGGIDSQASSSTTVFPLDFGNHHPLVTTAFACLTGNFEDGSQEDQNLAETFLASGAGVYIGATQVGIGDSRAFVKQFYDLWPNSDALSVGYAWTRAERDQWYAHSSNKSNLDPNYFGYTTWEFNVYGDPKYGLTKPAESSEQAPADSAPPPETLNVQIPDYVVTERNGLDFVEIPGGKMWVANDQVWLPYYTLLIECPPGYEPQDVALADRSGRTSQWGLELPVNPPQFAPCECAYLPNPGLQDWFPEPAYDWRAIENADDSSTLVIDVFPFRYNSRTTEAEFFRDFSFDINYYVSPAEITAFVPNQATYEPGDVAQLDLAMVNRDEARDVVFQAVVKPYGSDQAIDGLLVETLRGFSGAASYRAHWDTRGSEPGYYAIEATLTDLEGRVLDSESILLRVGAPLIEVTEFVVTPQVVTPDSEALVVGMSLRNAGSIQLGESTAVIQFFNSAGALLLAAEHPLVELPPSAEFAIEQSLPLTDLPLDSYTVVATVRYDGLSTAPIIVETPAALPGTADFDMDDDVDGADFLIWQAGFGIASEAAFSQGDADIDGDVDRRDLAIWERQFDATALPELAAVVAASASLVAPVLPSAVALDSPAVEPDLPPGLQSTSRQGAGADALRAASQSFQGAWRSTARIELPQLAPPAASCSGAAWAPPPALARFASGPRRADPTSAPMPRCGTVRPQRAADDGVALLSRRREVRIATGGAAVDSLDRALAEWDWASEVRELMVRTRVEGIAGPFIRWRTTSDAVFRQWGAGA